MGRLRSDWLPAGALTLCLFLLYNANGREIPSYDSQPAKYTAIELATRGTLRLNHVVGRIPALAERPGFALDRRGNYRSAYPLPSALAAAGVAWGLAKLHLLDLSSPIAAAVVAKLTASMLTALAAAAAFFCARAVLPVVPALLVAFGFGAGTNMWAAVSQTLWQQETALCALMIAIAMLMAPNLTRLRALLVVCLLALAAAARPQLAPCIAVLAVSVVARLGVRVGSILILTPLAAAAAVVMGLNTVWFGHLLGAVPRLEALHAGVHFVPGSLTASVQAGMLGLLISPSRGLLVFSPIVAIAAVGASRLTQGGWTSERPERRWCAAAIAVQFLLYSTYSVWWGGHTFGPRYALDALPMMVPLGADGVEIVGRHATGRALAIIALVWSVAAAGTGAFVYPSEAWNSDPTEIDRAHGRLWDWRDPQLLRCWQTGPSPQNFDLVRYWRYR
jgi:hypothetical protein